MNSSPLREQVGSLAFPLGIQQALWLFETVAPSIYQQQPRLRRIRISSDNASWSWPAGDKGGDAVDLFIAFAGKKAAEVIADINKAIAQFGADAQRVFGPENQVEDDAEADAFPLDAFTAASREDK
jgi:hypothetical protein